MAVKRLAAAQPAAADTAEALYTPGSGREATVWLNIHNTTSSTVTVSVWLVDGGLVDLVAEDALFTNRPLQPNGNVNGLDTLNAHRIAIGPTDTLCIASSATAVSFVTAGVETAATS